jgi:hypothetical protein
MDSWGDFGQEKTLSKARMISFEFLILSFKFKKKINPV